MDERKEMCPVCRNLNPHPLSAPAAEFREIRSAKKLNHCAFFGPLPGAVSFLRSAGGGGSVPGRTLPRTYAPETKTRSGPLIHIVQD